MELFDKTAQPDWPWFEELLSYDNAKLAHALLLSGRTTGQKPFLTRGLEALRWLANVQSFGERRFPADRHQRILPARLGAAREFHQQPIEAQAMVSACLEAYRRTSDAWWVRTGPTRLRVVPRLERSRPGTVLLQTRAVAGMRCTLTA